MRIILCIITGVNPHRSLFKNMVFFLNIIPLFPTAWSGVDQKVCRHGKILLYGRLCHCLKTVIKYSVEQRLLQISYCIKWVSIPAWAGCTLWSWLFIWGLRLCLPFLPWACFSIYLYLWYAYCFAYVYFSPIYGGLEINKYNKYDTCSAVYAI